MKGEFSLVMLVQACDNLDQGRLAGAIITQYAGDFSRVDLHVDTAQGDNAPVVLGVAYMAGEKCQTIVAKAGVVFPSRRDATEITSKIYAKQGLDPEAFTGPVKEGNTFYLPVTDYGADVTALSIPAMEDLWANRKPASTLGKTNDAINNVFID